MANRNENGVELINKDGHSYLIPASNKDNPVINCFYKWEQAFRVYAGIYAQVHPVRAHEPFQLIAHEAAQSFVWDNAYDYDIMFQELMEKNPYRGWGILYQQGYMARLKEHNGNNNSSASHRDSQSSSSTNSQIAKKVGFAGNGKKGNLLEV